ncbi:MAG: hydroxyisourate hydrolase [Armatimonadetes bacterium]|nr:hydroxyisourate hydrolase [Akkermansiaceae bacterium]
MGKLTTHVLDTVSGKPAVGVAVRLFQGGIELKNTVTGADGRLDEPLLADGEGEYVLVFEVGEYFLKSGYKEGIFKRVEIRFEMEKDGVYHVPLVCTPWSYSTYRGS